MGDFWKKFVTACCGRDESQMAPATAGERPVALHKKTSVTSGLPTGPGRVDDVYKRAKKKLGEGSYGTVSTGEHRNSKQKRAIKEISLQKANKSQQQFQRLKLEIEIMQSLDHPGIVRLYETFQDSKNVYLVMELSLGGELFDAITENTSFGEKDAAIIMQQMVASIFYLHSNSVCHRDLKPENFLLQFPKPKKISDNVLKLIDFGLSCRYKPGQRFRTKAGTPYYVAPQVLAGDYDQSSDLWSCGVIMYVLLCGYPPFYAESDNQVLQKVKKGHYEYDKKDWKGISDDSRKLIDGMLTMDETKRVTAQQALNDKWIKEKAPGAKNVPLSADFVNNLQKFAGQNKLKKAALAVIAGFLNDTQVKNLRELFKSLDANGDGMLSAEEIRSGVEKARIHLGTDIQALIKDLDTDGSGAIDYTEFIAATIDMKTATLDDNLAAAFCVFDKDGNGKISLQELKDLMKAEGVSDAMGQKSAEEVMRAVDSDGNGEIDFKEFCSMMKAN